MRRDLVVDLLHRVQLRAVTVQAQRQLSVLEDEFPLSPEHLLLDVLAHLIHAWSRLIHPSLPHNLLDVDRMQGLSMQSVGNKRCGCSWARPHAERTR